MKLWCFASSLLLFVSCAGTKSGGSGAEYPEGKSENRKTVAVESGPVDGWTTQVTAEGFVSALEQIKANDWKAIAQAFENMRALSKTKEGAQRVDAFHAWLQKAEFLSDAISDWDEELVAELSAAEDAEELFGLRLLRAEGHIDSVTVGYETVLSAFGAWLPEKDKRYLQLRARGIDAYTDWFGEGDFYGKLGDLEKLYVDIVAYTNTYQDSWQAEELTPLANRLARNIVFLAANNWQDGQSWKVHKKELIETLGRLSNKTPHKETFDKAQILIGPHGQPVPWQTLEKEFGDAFGKQK